MFEDLKTKTLLITGASSGIGRATAIMLANMGARVIINGRSEERLNETFSKLDKSLQHKIIKADISENDGIELIIKDIKNIPLDGVVYCAGIVKPLPLKFIKQHHIDEVFKINYTAPVLLTSALFANNLINKGASFVFLSSISSKHPYFGGALYTSSKAALEAYAKTIAVEYSSKKIRSNIISPGLVETPILELSREANTPEAFKIQEASYPFGFGKPEEVARLATFLISSASGWITGQNIMMDGGHLLYGK
jgi:NAD(P)-dependent dehydrogenase (short-subunit alcohol dehydrogenase family)